MIGLLIVGVFAFVSYIMATNLVGKTINSLNENQIDSKYITSKTTISNCVDVSAGAKMRGVSSDEMAELICNMYRNGNDCLVFYDYSCDANKYLVCQYKPSTIWGC